MVNVVKSTYTDDQITAWLRGLLTIAWADGHYTAAEQELIGKITEQLDPDKHNQVKFKSITPEELAERLGKDHSVGENFLRTAVLVSIADGVYSQPEAEQIEKFRAALGIEVEELQSLEATLYHPDSKETEDKKIKPHLLKPMKNWLDNLEMQDPRVAKFICKMVPSQCPFERDITLFDHKIVHIPPLCKLNPLYEQLVGLRFRALSYLADECQEDVSEYI